MLFQMYGVEQIFRPLNQARIRYHAQAHHKHLCYVPMCMKHVFFMSSFPIYVFPLLPRRQ
jgi:hypothetical protein